MTRRVAVTGGGAVSTLGGTWPEVRRNLESRKNAVRFISEWCDAQRMSVRIAAPVADFETPSHYSRKHLRSMERLAVFAVRASELALDDAGLLGDPVLCSGRCGVAMGTSSGSPKALEEFAPLQIDHDARVLKATTYLRNMSHSGPVSVGIFFGLTGRVIPTSSACTSGSQGIGYAYEAIRHGIQDVMIAGGSEELSITTAGVFDRVFAASTRNEAPELVPRPFDADRDGLVVGEGGAALILEDWDRAKARGARILAEVVGFGTNSDGAHVTLPSEQTMLACLRLALEDAGIPGSEIGYVSAHATATSAGDVMESRVTEEAIRANVPISSLKSYTGHTLGACGALEAWTAIEMMNDGWFAPTINLDRVDPECAQLDYLQGDGKSIDCEYVMNNNFAFGGLNSSLIFRRAT